MDVDFACHSIRGGSITSAGKILIVDDSEESLKLLTGVLGAEGYDVRPADSGELALAAISVSPPELILLDMRMPGMDGLEVCKRIKSRPESNGIPIIFLSATVDFEDRLEGLESGAVDFINKPFRREELLARLRTHLELSRLRNELEQRVSERTIQLQTAYDQLKSELAIRTRVEEELRESEHRFRSIADTAPVGIWISDRDGQITYVSQWCLDFAGLRQEQLGGEGWYDLMHPEDRTRIKDSIASDLRQTRGFQIEFRLRRSDGAYRWMASTGTPRIVNGAFVGHIGSIVDITELKRIQEHALAVQKLESLGVLAAGIAHDFNNLLSTILAYADLALHEIDDDSPAHTNVANIGTVAVRAAEIVKLLLTYAGHSDTGSPEPVDASAVCAEMVQLLKISIPKTATLTARLAPSLPPVGGNPGQIRQVILNLIINAAEALQEKPGTVEVSTAIAHVGQQSIESAPPGLPEGDYVLLSVSDTGCGMSEETRLRIFDPFYSTKFLGRGLGLASVHGIVRGLGGAISVSSTLGQGSTFTVWLPLWQSKVITEAGPTATASKAASTVLLVEDEDGLRFAVSSALKREGFSVYAARDGISGIQLFSKQSNEIDIVVLDLTLPGLSGHDVWTEIQRIRPDVPVLFTSAQSMQESSDATGGGRLLQKPYRLRDLIRTIREITASRGLQ